MGAKKKTPLAAAKVGAEFWPAGRGRRHTPYTDMSIETWEAMVDDPGYYVNDMGEWGFVPGTW